MHTVEIGSQEEFERALEAGHFDLVITDYQLRWTDGLAVLRILTERFPERPVIMFTNSGSQEVAVEAMKAGLDDYILKSAQHYVRLPVAVRGALERRATEQRLEALDRRLRGLLTRVNVGIFRATADGRLLECNPAFVHLLGIADDAANADLDLLALGLLDDMPPNDQALEHEVALRRPDGRTIWVAVSMARSGSPDDPVLDGMAEDITARKRAEEAARFLAEAGKELAASLDERETLARLMRLVVPRLADWCVVDLVGGETPRQLVLTASGAQEVRGPVEIASPKPWPGAEAALRTGTAARYEPLTPANARALRTLHAQSAEVAAAPSAARPARRGGRNGLSAAGNGSAAEAPRAALVAPLAARGDVLGALTLVVAGAGQGSEAADLGLLEEFAGRASLALENARLYREARESIEVRDRFLGLAAHELRTPLASMIPSIQMAEQRIARLRAMGGTSVARPAAHHTLPPASSGAPSGRADRGDPLEQTEDALRRLWRQTRRLARLVDDLVDVTRIQRGLLELRRAPHDLRDLAREAVEEQRLAEPDREITLDLPDSPLEAEVDGDRVEQVITNLLTNALKFSPPDKPVAVLLTREDGHARLAVRDQGPGMPPAELARIWDLYYRARGLEHQSGSGIGLGLGLYICQEIITRTGGQIGAESTPGQGSTFWFTLPLDSPGPHPR